MKQKGFSLIEIVCAIALIGMIGMMASIGSKMVMRAQLEKSTREVVAYIEYAKQAASCTGRLYNLLSYKDHVYLIHDGYRIGEIVLGEPMRIPNGITGMWLKFNGTIAPRKGGTIILMNEDLGLRARITVVPVTGKVRVYYESC